MDDEARYAVVDSTVVGHQRYGVLVRSDSGRPGFIDRADLADGPAPPHEWPAIGDRVRAVVLGPTRTGRLRLCTRPSYLALIGSVTDPAVALAEWVRAADPGARQEFYRSPNARPLLRWALRQPAGSPDRRRAEDLLAGAPPDLRSRSEAEDR